MFRILPSHPAYPRLAELQQILCWYTNPHLVINWRDYDENDNLIFIESDTAPMIAECKAEIRRLMSDIRFGRFVTVNES